MTKSEDMFLQITENRSITFENPQKCTTDLENVWMSSEIFGISSLFFRRTRVTFDSFWWSFGNLLSSYCTRMRWAHQPSAKFLVMIQILIVIYFLQGRGKVRTYWLTGRKPEASTQVSNPDSWQMCACISCLKGEGGKIDFSPERKIWI